MTFESESVYRLNMGHIIATVGATVNNDSREAGFKRYQHGSRNQGEPHLIREILPLHRGNR